MKTKFLRFPKQLARIDTIQPTNNKPPDSASVFDSPYRKTDAPKSELSDMIHAIMKQTQSQSRSYQLQPRDRSVVVALPDIEESQEIPMQVLKSWISQVCTKVVSSAFNLLISDKLSYEQAKVSCSQGILRNIVLLVQKYSLTKDHIKEINSHIEVNVVPYLKRKYPMTESSDVNKSLDQSVKSVDKLDALENDLLFKSNVIFTYNQNGNYNKKIMEFVNWLMLEIDTAEDEAESPKTVYQQFFDHMSKTFEKVYSQNWMNKTRESILNNVMVSKVQGSKIDASAQDLSKLAISNQISNQKYAEQVKDYTHYIIGRKISKNVPIYSQNQIEEEHLTIKSPSVLRILTKWCQQLWKKFKKKNFFLDRQQNLRVQESGGNINTMFMWMKMPLNDMIQAEKQQIYEFMNNILQNNFDQQTELLKQELFSDDGYYHIEKHEKVCGKFATKAVNNLHSYIVIYLNRLIHGLLTVAKQLYEEKLSTKARWTSPPDLLTFKVGDLMRCKCSSKQREILHIYKQLERVSKVDPKTLKIIRVKNRLKLGTNDILINILYKDKFMCEIQLAVKSAQSNFIACSNSWNHYIYELGRTIFGPITQLCSVWMSLDPRSAEYDHIIKNQKPKKISGDEPCVNQQQKHSMQYHSRPFICSKCKIAYSHSNYFWNHMKCDNKGCSYVICATCRIDDQKEETLKQKLLKEEPILLKASKGIINRKKQSQQDIPEYGLCIPINSKQIKIQRFKRIYYKNIWTIFGLQKKRKGDQRVLKIDQHIKKSQQKKFLKKYLVIQISSQQGQGLIDITLDRAKKECLIPAKVKQVYKKQKQILSLIEENIDDKAVQIIKGKTQGMNHITNLQLADNKLTNIKFIVSNFKKLQRLQLSRNIINNIDGISILKNLGKLNLRNNKLSVLPDQICQLKNLKGINIRHNQITALPEEFGNLYLLDKMESDNNLISVLPDSFSKLRKLKFIDLSSNKLTQFPEHIKNFDSLKELSLSKNKLGFLPDWINEFKDIIVSLDLSKTGLSNFPSAIFQLQKLQILKIESFHDQLSSDIAKLQSLRELSIQMKNLKEIPKDIFQLKKLQLLQVCDCQMKDLPDCLSEMENLQSFGLINNKLTSLSSQLFQMTKLRNLKLEGQNLKQLPKELTQLSDLRTLSLSNNILGDFPQIILQFSKLYSLKLKNTQLKAVPNDLIQYLPDLEELDISQNLLTSIPLSLSTAKKLTERRFKFDKDKISVPKELQFVVSAFNQSVQNHTFFERNLTMSKIFSHRMQSRQSM